MAYITAIDARKLQKQIDDSPTSPFNKIADAARRGYNFVVITEKMNSEERREKLQSELLWRGFTVEVIHTGIHRLVVSW